jgi:2-succinyl-6-hydroxy-2,4-cyclohexadiene-1-carboxylate synthase
MPDPKTSSSGPALLALHGFSGGGADFDPLIEALGGQLHWLCPDLPGHGAGHSHPCDPQAIVTYINGLVPQLGQPKILLGYSMGARAALLHATAHPDCWQALILISARSGIGGERAQRRILDEQRACEIESLGLRAFLQAWQNQPLIRSQQNIPDALRANMQATRSGHTVSGLARSMRDFGQGNCPDLTSRLHRLKMPIQLITGENDPLYRQHAEQMLPLLANASHTVIPRAGHMPHLENLAASATTIRTFIKKTATAHAANSQESR